MKRNRFITIALAFVCAFALMGLVACGGGSSSGESSSGGSSGEPKQETAPAPTDEELIKADFESMVSSALSADALLEGLEKDSSMKEFQEIGLDLKEYAENMAKIFKVNVDNVDIKGDTAAVKATLTLPDFGDESDKLTEKALEKATKGLDPSKMSKDEQIELFGKVMNDVLCDPDFPTTTTDFSVDYGKNNGSWQLKDVDTIKSLLENMSAGSSDQK